MHLIYLSVIHIQWILPYPDPTYPDYSLIRTDMFGNQSPFLNRKWLTNPEIQLFGQSVWERRCPDKWGSTVLHAVNSTIVEIHVQLSNSIVCTFVYDNCNDRKINVYSHTEVFHTSINTDLQKQKAVTHESLPQLECWEKPTFIGWHFITFFWVIPIRGLNSGCSICSFLKDSDPVCSIYVCVTTVDYSIHCFGSD